MTRRYGTGVVVAVVLLLSLVVLVPALAPVRLGYVSTDDGQSTLSPGDAYVAVPPGVVEPGDVVVYWSSAREEYVVRRVVEATDRGFVTGRDANEPPDREGDEPPIPRSAIVGEIPRVAGHLLAVPGLGRTVPVLQRYRVLGGVLVAALVAGLLVRRRRRRRTHASGPSVLRVRDVAVPILLVVLVGLVAVAPLGSTSYQLAYVATADGSASTVPVGESVTRNVSVGVVRLPFTTNVVRADGATILDTAFDGSTLDLRVSIPPPTAAGPRRVAIHVHPYPATLPRDTIERLHDVSPVAASLATGLAVFLPLYLLYLLLFDGERPLSVSRSPWFDRLRGS